MKEISEDSKQNTNQNNKTIDPNRDPKRMQKTLKQAQINAFTTQLFYYSIKILFCFILLKTKNILWGQYLLCTIFCILLCLNTYLISYGGKDPGFQAQKNQKIIQMNQQLSSLKQEINNYCDICQCYIKLRTKHCFRCGRCVRKYDHHCPWIGTCVGQKNHCYFVVMLFFQFIQASYAFWICFVSMQMFEYKQQSGNFNAQFGVFASFSIYMSIYILFTGGLLCYHCYIIAANITTTQLTKRYSTKYLRGVKGNPFSQGCLKNIALSINIPKQGHEWTIRTNNDNINKKRSILSQIWSNQYYDCC